VAVEIEEAHPYAAAAADQLPTPTLTLLSRITFPAPVEPTADSSYVELTSALELESEVRVRRIIVAIFMVW
jgi:hypothetical protein